MPGGNSAAWPLRCPLRSGLEGASPVGDVWGFIGGKGSSLRKVVNAANEVKYMR